MPFSVRKRCNLFDSQAQQRRINDKLMKQKTGERQGEIGGERRAGKKMGGGETGRGRWR